MYPPVWAIVTADNPLAAEVRSVFGSPAPRVYPFGGAPQGAQSPYALWQTVSGSPENYLGEAPDLDGWLVQFDVYASSSSDLHSGAKALRDVLEQKAHIENWRGDDIDPDTKEYRYSFDVRFLVPR